MNMKWTSTSNGGPRCKNQALSSLNRAYGAPTGDKPMGMREALAWLVLSAVFIGTAWIVADFGYALIVAGACILVIALSGND